MHVELGDLSHRISFFVRISFFASFDSYSSLFPRALGVSIKRRRDKIGVILVCLSFAGLSWLSLHCEAVVIACVVDWSMCMSVGVGSFVGSCHERDTNQDLVLV